MAFDLTTAKARLGIADASKDAKIQGALDAALAIAETYCGRRFMHATETAVFTHPKGSVLQLSRFPIDGITSVQDGSGVNVSVKYHTVFTTGQLIFDGNVGHHQVLVSYSGGYATLPADLELALWALFNETYSASDTSAGTSSVGGTISSVSVPDVGTIKFDTGSSSSSGAGGAQGIIPGISLAILELYRLKVC